MRTIIKNIPQINGSQVELKNFKVQFDGIVVAVLISGRISILQREKYGIGTYRFVCVDECFINGNGLITLPAETIKESIGRALENNYVESVMEFKDFLEFSKWYVKYREDFENKA